MALLTTLDPYILLEVQEASLPLLASVEKRVLRDFCTRTKIWIGDITAFNTVANTQTYAVTPPSNSEVVRFERVRFNGVPLEPITENDLDASDSAWETQTGTPTHYFSRDGMGLSLFPIPSLIGQVTARASLRPSAATDSFPDFLNTYLDHITAGVKAALMLMPMVAWHNAQVGSTYAAIYEAGVNSASANAFHALTKARRRTVPQFF